MTWAGREPPKREINREPPKKRGMALHAFVRDWTP